VVSATRAAAGKLKLVAQPGMCPLQCSIVRAATRVNEMAQNRYIQPAFLDTRPLADAALRNTAAAGVRIRPSASRNGRTTFCANSGPRSSVGLRATQVDRRTAVPAPAQSSLKPRVLRATLPEGDRHSHISPDDPLVHDSSSTSPDCYDQVVMFGGKRELLTRGLFWTGGTSLLGQLPARDSLLVLNYHRIGNPDDDPFDPGVFSATGHQLNEQISYLKRRVSLVTLEEALAFVDGRLCGKSPRCRVLITFDDGYLDNYEVAFPILRSHGVQGVFFLATSMVGSCSVPWWDHIAFLMKTARQRRFSLHYPADLAVDLVENGMTKSLRDVLRLYKRPGNADPERFIRELKEEANGKDLPETLRRFLNWDEAREMIAGGMAIGSHTHSHTVLSQLGPEQQRHELAQSRGFLREQLGIEPDALAYPVGGTSSFSDQTQQLARECGYRAAFSFHGGTNLPRVARRYDVKRVGVGDQSWPRFRVQTAICRVTGNYWP
jgi:peptidoglycan/xylan/chitin deacetylase (PgdA/CDA1 family)